MAGDRQKDAASMRLSASAAGETDAEIADRVLKSVGDAVGRRTPPSDEEASRVASTEVQQMRAQKRAKRFVAARAHG